MSTYDFLCDLRDRQAAALYAVNVREVSFPDAEIVSLEDAQLHCRVDTFEEGSPPETVSADDAWLTDIGIPAAREYCEADLGLALAVRTMELKAEAFPSEFMPLPFGPVQSITSVIYTDRAAADAAYEAAYVAAYDIEFANSADVALAEAAGVAAGDIAYDAALMVTMPTTDYVIDTATTPMRLRLAHGATWPTATTEAGSVTVRYVVGYSAPADSPQVYILPRLAKAAVLVMLTHLYDHRGDESIDAPVAVASLLARVRGREFVGFA